MNESHHVMQATARGVGWNASIFVLSKGSIFLSTIILARLLVPQDFGLLALGLLAMHYLESLSDLGVGPALIYRQDAPETTSSVAFWLNLGMSLMLATGAFFGAPLMAAFFNEPALTPIIRVLVVGVLLSGLRNVPESRLKKALNFRLRFLPELCKTLTKGGVSVGLAWMGFGVWSLVWGQLAGEAVSTLLYWRVSRWRPQLIFDVSTARSLISYGSQIILVGLLGMLHQNVDYLIIGHRLDTAQLGFYTMAFRLPEIAIINMCYIISQALFPAYAKLQHDLPALREGFLLTLRYLALVTVPMGVGMCLLAPEFVYVFYSERWAPAIPAMQMLALFALIRSLSFHAGDIFKAIGRPAILNQTAIVKLLLTMPVLWAAAGYNIFYVAVGQVLTTIVFTLLMWGIASRILGLRLLAMMASLKPAILGAALMLLGMLALRTQLLHYGPAVRLLGLTLTGMLVYSATLWCTHRELLTQVVALVSSTGQQVELGPQPPAHSTDNQGAS